MFKFPKSPGRSLMANDSGGVGGKVRASAPDPDGAGKRAAVTSALEDITAPKAARLRQNTVPLAVGSAESSALASYRSKRQAFKDFRGKYSFNGYEGNPPC
jgi:hypothetical protein